MIGDAGGVACNVVASACAMLYFVEPLLGGLMRWWWTSRMRERCTRWERRSPRSGGMLKVMKLEFVFVLAEEIIQVVPLAMSSL